MRIILEQLEQGIAKSYKLRKLESLILKIFFTIFTIFFFLIFHSCFKLNSWRNYIVEWFDKC